MGCDDSPPPARPTPAVTKTKVEVRESEKKVEVKVPYVPAECTYANSLAVQLRGLVGKYEAAMGKETSIQEDTHTAILNKDTPGLMRVDERQRALKAETLQLLLDIRAVGSRLQDSIVECDEKIR